MFTKATLDLFKKNQSLFICIFSVLIFQLTVTFTVFYSLKDQENPLREKLYKNYPIVKERPILFFLIIPIIFTYFILIAIHLTPSFPIKLALFSVFAVFKAFFLTLTHTFISNEVIMFGLLATIGIFVLMLFFASVLINMKFDMLQYGGLLFSCLLTIFFISLINLFFLQDSLVTNILRFCILVIMTIYIIYDTYEILYRQGIFTSDCVSGAIDYYIDFMSIFRNLTKLADDLN